MSGSVNALGALGLGLKGLEAQTKADAAKAGATAQHRVRPNVLLLLSDQHRRSCMGVAGDALAVTPNLDRLAREGVRFTAAYCDNPVCAPSRATLVTGLHAHHHGCINNSTPFPVEHKTVADSFHHAGYSTASIGKMHFVDSQTHGFNFKLDFNDWFQYLGPKTRLHAEEVGHADSGAGLPQIEGLWASKGDPWKGNRQLDERKGEVAIGRVSEFDEADHFDSFVARESVRFLESRAKEGEPFFLVTSFLKPHEPFMPARRFAEMFRPEQMQMSPTWGKAELQNLPRLVKHSIETSSATPELLDPAKARERMAFYYSNVAQMDDCAGQVLDALKRLGLEENTIVVYSADHGEMHGDLGLWGKSQFYEGSCGVPLIFRMPGASPAVCDVPIGQVSLADTLTDLCHVPPAGPTDGRSFAELVRQPGGGFNYGPVFAEFDVGNSNAKYMVRDGNLKYTYWTHDIAELYDLQADPQELHNLAARPEHAATVQRLKRELLAWHQPSEG